MYPNLLTYYDIDVVEILNFCNNLFIHTHNDYDLDSNSISRYLNLCQSKTKILD